MADATAATKGVEVTLTLDGDEAVLLATVLSRISTFGHLNTSPIYLPLLDALHSAGLDREEPGNLNLSIRNGAFQLVRFDRKVN